MPAVEKHVVCFASQAWGHARPLLHLSARFAKLRPGVAVTFLATNAFFERVKTELARAFADGDEELSNRVRVIAIGAADLINSDEVDKQFEATWKVLVEEGEPQCTFTGSSHSSWPKPAAAILDFFALKPFTSINTISGKSVKRYAWCSGLTYALLGMWGPEIFGGPGNVRVKIEERARATGKTFHDVAIEFVLDLSDDVQRLPGLPPMYKYERTPQDFPIPPHIAAAVLPYVSDLVEASDGIFLFTPESYEPDAVAAVRRWFGETGRPVYTTGPLLPDTSKSKGAAADHERKLSKEGAEIQQFLDDTLKSSGERSLVYISFGSVFWPAKSPEKVWTVLDVLIESNIPFILSHASPFATVPDEVKEKVKSFGKGLLSTWTPQQLILDHPVTGWFIAHGGHNGVTEAISAGVPQIIWPFGGDQAQNAILISEIHKIGYELLEVRTGNGLRPIYRNGFKPVGTIDALKEEVRDVLKKAFGEDGKEKRARLEEVRKGVIGAWEEGGSSLRDVSAFLQSL